MASGESVQTTLTFTFPAGFAETVGLARTGLPANATMGSITLLGAQGRFAGALRVSRGLRYRTVAAMGLVAGCGGSGVYNIVVTASSTSGSQSVPYVLTVK